MSAEPAVRAAGGVRPKRFLLVTAPSTLACLTVVAGIFLGWFSVAIASAKPLDVASSRGSADRLFLTVGTDRAVTGLAHSSRAERPVTVISVDEAHLDDLCLIPRFDLPVFGRLASIKISSGAGVTLGSLNMAALDTRVGSLQVPRTTIGGAGGPEALSGAPGGFSVLSEGEPQEIKLAALSSQLYGLTLKDGLTLRSIGIRADLGDQHC